MLVQTVVNEFANNGFCTIARAGANETGETFIYDFSHYIRQRQLDEEPFWADLYAINEAQGPDIEGWGGEESDRNIKGYYFRLKDINNKIDELSTALESQSAALL
jgi:hypothetical protein